MATATNAIAETFLSEGELSIDNSDKGGLTYLGVAFNKWPKAPFWDDIISVITSVAPSISATDLKNLGTGKGTSVLEMVNAFMRVNQVAVPYKIVDRRPGDIATCYADVSKAERELDWRAEFTIDEMVRDAWKFEQKQGLIEL